MVVSKLSTSKNYRRRQIQSAQPAKVDSSQPEPIRVKNNSKLSLSFGDICKATAAFFSSKDSQFGQAIFDTVSLEPIFQRSTQSPFVLASMAVEVCCRTKSKPDTKYTNQLIYILLYIHIIIHRVIQRYVYGDASNELQSLIFWFTQ